MNYITRLLLASMIILILFTPSEAQKKIKLTNKESNQEIFLKEGARVSYILNNQDGRVVGILKKVDLNQLVVDDETISIEDIKAIGRKKKGSGAGTFIFGFLGGALIVISLAPGPDCPNCQTDTSAKTSGIVTGVLAGVSLGAVALHIGAKNSLKDVSKKWKLEIVD